MYNIDYILKLAAKFEEKYVSKNQYVYHIKHDNFKGKFIYSLSQLKQEYPDLYKKEIKKYKGRENHPEIKIDVLNAKWQDCVNFSTLNPIKIFLLEELLGFPGYKDNKNIEIFRFNIKDLSEFDMCLYDDNLSPKNKEAYKKITPIKYKETPYIPTETIKYFAESKNKKEYPLLFGNVTHLLINNNIPINKADLIKFKGSGL